MTPKPISRRTTWLIAMPRSLPEALYTASRLTPASASSAYSRLRSRCRRSRFICSIVRCKGSGVKPRCRRARAVRLLVVIGLGRRDGLGGGLTENHVVHHLACDRRRRRATVAAVFDDHGYRDLRIVHRGKGDEQRVIAE